jgi:hypothetical protein
MESGQISASANRPRDPKRHGRLHERAMADCDSSKCQGQLRSPGGDSLYQFITTSRVYLEGNVTVYETCVENQSNRSMEFNWFIPGPASFVPDGWSCSNPRPKLTHADSPTYAGCLYFGNNRARGHATFFPHVDDAANIAADKKDPQCKITPTTVSTASITQAAALSALAGGIAVKLGAFAPSDLKNEAQTMAYIRAAITLIRDPKEDGKYIHSIKVPSSSFRDSKPDFESLRLVPEKNNIADFNKSVPGGQILLKQETSLSAELQLPKAPMLDTI